MIFTDKDLENNFSNLKNSEENNTIIEDSEYFGSAEYQEEVNKNSEILKDSEKNELIKVKERLQQIEKIYKNQEKDRLEKKDYYLSAKNIDLKIYNCKIKRNRMIINPDITLDNWKMIGRGFKTLNQSVQWWVYDWICYGIEREWNISEQYDKLEKITEYKRKTLKQIKWIGDKILSSRLDSRMIKNKYGSNIEIPFFHYQEVMSLDDELQEQLLKQAIDENWSQKRLRKEVKQIKGDVKIKKDKDNNNKDKENSINVWDKELDIMFKQNKYKLYKRELISLRNKINTLLSFIDDE